MRERDSITDNALPETMIQDICELDSINSITILTIAYDEINWDIYSSLSLGNLRVGN
jgi:hypothetical protein